MQHTKKIPDTLSARERDLNEVLAIQPNMQRMKTFSHKVSYKLQKKDYQKPANTLINFRIIYRLNFKEVRQMSLSSLVRDSRI